MRKVTGPQTLAERLFQCDVIRLSNPSDYRFSAEACAHDVARPLWMGVTAIIRVAFTYFSPAALASGEVARAAPILDPRTPIPFLPTVTQASTGVPAGNIATPNASGVAENRFQLVNIASRRLVPNNTAVAGASLLGNTLEANPNLNSRTETTLINQMTSTWPAYALYEPFGMFRAPAAIMIASPNGLTVNGPSATNVTNLTVTTGTPQFLTDVGGSPVSFANAGVAAYNVTSRNITINGPLVASIEGTVGNSDLVGWTANINALLHMDQRVNVTTDNQFVSSTASGSAGVTYATADSVLPNNATLTPAANDLAIDARQYLRNILKHRSHFDCMALIVGCLSST
ncbi:two-partner secretion domain-containing protein [Burkholderia thailandensis]|uniref:two-partner secretion domain-containing protein n=1 Tax=Burkholderia thailandensis TaxID=57975 RepID=UPI002D78D8AB|nr:hypothetical protein [Burkholderia thailandensis]WRS69865.1 hypothetical protein U9S59_29925 [Burkholderia thailandensis]